MSARPQKGSHRQVGVLLAGVIHPDTVGLRDECRRQVARHLQFVFQFGVPFGFECVVRSSPLTVTISPLRTNNAGGTLALWRAAMASAEASRNSRLLTTTIGN